MTSGVTHASINYGVVTATLLVEIKYFFFTHSYILLATYLF